MRHLLFIFALLLSAFSLKAQTDTIVTKPSVKDTVGTTLDEVVVQGRTQRIVKYGVEYTPDKRMKRQAADASKLLQAMQIPQLVVNPISKGITTLSGKSVSMFIDYVPATDDDLSGLRPEDVLRVEVLDYPEDPRFNSAQHVVNFIMHKYEWGGYTKLSGRAWFLEENRGNANVYSKYVRKRWTLDASAGGTLAYGNQARGHNEEIYRDIMFRGNHYDELRRITHIDDAYTHSNNEWGSLRLSYSSDSLYIQHQAGFSRYAEPGNMTRTSLSFSDAVVGDNLMSERRSDSQNLSPWLSGYYWISMPRGNTLNISWNFSYGSRRSHNNYAVNGMEPILNSNREKYYSPTANLTYSKQLGHGNTFRTSLVSYNTIYHTDYYGSYDGRQSLLSSENMLFLEYMQNWKCGLNLFSRVGMSYVIGRVNSHTNLKQWNPRLGLQLQYKINDRHSASIEGWWGNSHPGASTSNTALVQSNELLWLQGNTRLRNTIFRQATASYSFIPNNRYSLSASVEWEGEGNKQAYDYFVLPGYDGVVRRTINSGNANRYTASLNGTASFFDSRLRINVYASANHVRLTGIDRQHCNWIVGQAIVSYYFGNFDINMRYCTPQKSIDAYSGGIVRSYPSIYEFYANYTVGNFKFSTSIPNWFSKGAHIRSNYVGTHHYAEKGWTSGDFNPNIFFSVTYTFSYGKKVRMGNELQNQGGGGSAILQ